MNWWAVIIVAFTVALLPWQIFRYARRRSDSSVSKSSQQPKPSEREEAYDFW